jgi:Protein of unknown function (DUF2934)
MTMTELLGFADTTSPTIAQAVRPFESSTRDAADAATTSDAPPDRECRIRDAAYRHFVERGCVDGHDLDDWLMAEAEIDRD